MKWTLHPKSEGITTTLPMSIELEGWSGTPRVYISGLGELNLVPVKGKLRSEFYFTLPGTYRLEVKDKETLIVTDLVVEEHQYLDFKNEFGFFFILFLIVMGGIILWTKKIMQK